MPGPGKDVRQTLTVMEAAITVVPGREEELHRVHSQIVPVAARQPGYRWYGSGPIAHSNWAYFSGKFETPEAMDAWYRHPRHVPVEKLGFDRWFSSMYIRKWRLPSVEEAPVGRVFCETTIRTPAPLDEDRASALETTVEARLAPLNPRPFETLTGQFEDRNYQLVGPLDENPSDTRATYLLLTHWSSADDAHEWIQAGVPEACRDLGPASTSVFVPLPEEAGARPGLRSDGLQRDWIMPEPADQLITEPSTSAPR